MPIWALPLFSWLISFYFFSGVAGKLGFPPDEIMTITYAPQIAIWLFFLFLPFFGKIKIGKLLELERQLEQQKEEVKQIRENLQQNFSLLASSINTISNFSNQITVNLPSLNSVEKDKEKLEKETKTKTEEVKEIKSELMLENEDTVMSLARTRIRIEYLLRLILSKRIDVKRFGERPIKLMGLMQLFRLYIEEFPEDKKLESALSYVNNVCSAAIHAQRLPANSAELALDMGARIISVLEEKHKLKIGEV